MNSLRHTRFLAAAALAFGAFGAVSTAHAGSDAAFSLGFRTPVHVQQAPVYFQPQPVYVQREPVYSDAPFQVQRERGYRYHDEEDRARRRAEWQHREWQQHQQQQQWRHQQWQQPHAAPWVQGQVYEAGSIVRYAGRLYIAKMWNAGSLPTPNRWGWSDWSPYTG